eukprot:COSAG01_NODE_8238_length_2860_cov_3.532054_7_plen_21_part_01
MAQREVASSSPWGGAARVAVR